LFAGDKLRAIRGSDRRGPRAATTAASQPRRADRKF